VSLTQSINPTIHIFYQTHEGSTLQKAAINLLSKELCHITQLSELLINFVLQSFS